MSSLPARDEAGRDSGAARPAARVQRLVALAGNPNVGKSTVFNRLTGLRQKVSNYPGVTVERKTGSLVAPDGMPVTIIDVPGTYSLNPRSLDEEIAQRVLIGEIEGAGRPDLVVCLVDASNLERNLYLASQVMDLGQPTLLALNMVDNAQAAGVLVDAQKLGRELGVPVVPMVASRGEGIDELRAAICGPLPSPPERRWREATGIPREQAEIVGRYQWIGRVAARAVRSGAAPETSITDRIDAVATHRIAGPVLFFLVLALIFQSVFAWATPFMDAIDAGTGTLGGWARAGLPEGPLRSLLVDGVITGVGAVVVFLPQILILFLFLGLLEDTGYMARAAFIMDRIMKRVGLSGRSVVPLLSGFACAIPGVMATRTIDSPRDRLVTTMVVPLMTCSARLPVYALLISAFIPAGTFLGFLGYQGLMLLALYVLGVTFAVIAAWLLKRFVVRGDRSIFVMELPPYRMPKPRDVLWRLVERSKLFLTRAGTIIFSVAVVLWFLASYPQARPDAEIEAERAEIAALLEGTADPGVAASLDARLAEIDDAEASRALSESAIGRLGRFIEPLIQPLGYDWKIGVALIASLAAREVAVSALATIYAVQNADEKSTRLADRMRADIDPRTGLPVFTPLVAVSLMIFFVFACQCLATVAVVRRETGTWRWPLFMFSYMTVLAWAAAFVTYQGGSMLGWS